MAEFVESRMEEMIPVWEKIKQTDLIKQGKLKGIIGEIREHELKIQRPARTLEDFFSYFDYLKIILEKLKKKREKMNYYHHTTEIEDRLKTIITSRFGMANHNFKNNLNFWIYRLRFMKDMNWLDHVSNLFTEATKVIGSKYPELWIDASNFEWAKKPGSGKGIESARHFVQMGLRRHSDLASLYIQGFYLELKYIDFVRANPQEEKKVLGTENGKQILYDFVLAKSFYNEAKRRCQKDGSKLFHGFYSKAKQFTFTKNLCEEILEEMKSECYSEEATYDTLAKIALAEGNGKLFQANIDNCIRSYEDGLSARPTVQMYDLYISTLSQIVNHVGTASKYDFEVKLLQLFERAYENWKLSEQNYIEWFKLVKSIEDDDTREYKPSSNLSAKDILDICYSKFPTNSQILHEKISQEIIQKESINAQVGVINKYLKHLNLAKENTSSLWSGIFINATLQPKVKPEDCAKLFRMAPLSVKGQLGILFIKFFGCIDMFAARKFYDENCMVSNLGLEFHLEMAKLESTTLSDHENKEIILARITQCYENATEHYGKGAIEPWLEYIKFERFRRNVANTSTIHRRALVQLPPELKEEFILAEQRMGRT